MFLASFVQSSIFMRPSCCSQSRPTSSMHDCYARLVLTFLVPAHLGNPGKRVVKQVCMIRISEVRNCSSWLADQLPVLSLLCCCGADWRRLVSSASTWNRSGAWPASLCPSSQRASVRLPLTTQTALLVSTQHDLSVSCVLYCRTWLLWHNCYVTAVCICIHRMKWRHRVYGHDTIAILLV